MIVGAESGPVAPPGPAGGPDVTVAPTDDLDAVRALGVAAGLDESEREDGEVVLAWAARAADGAMIGAIVLERYDRLDVVNWMSVDAAYRGRGIATRLLATLEREASARGVRRLWATARTPGFFLANGFGTADEGPEAAYLVGDCRSCPQYHRDCWPQPVMKDL